MKKNPVFRKYSFFEAFTPQKILMGSSIENFRGIVKRRKVVQHEQPPPGPPLTQFPRWGRGEGELWSVESNILQD